MSKLSIVASVYNEEASLDAFYHAVTSALEGLSLDYELIFVNDGSTDDSFEIIEVFAGSDPHVKAVQFSRNFGHEAAMIAGIDHASGDFIICMDSDMQHPPECIPEMVDSFSKGHDIVLMARKANKDAGIIKNITSGMFYSLFNRISNEEFVPGVSDFFGMSSKVADLFRNNFREKSRYLRGYLQTVGFNREVIDYEAADRYAGESKYSIKVLFRVFFIAITCFSRNLLRHCYGCSAMSFLGALVLVIISIVRYACYGITSPAINVSAIVCFFFGIQFALTGVLGEYMYTVLGEAKGRPIYIVDKTIGIDRAEP